jgi:hypothetical protein
MSHSHSHLIIQTRFVLAGFRISGCSKKLMTMDQLYIFIAVMNSACRPAALHPSARADIPSPFVSQKLPIAQYCSCNRYFKLPEGGSSTNCTGRSRNEEMSEPAGTGTWSSPAKMFHSMAIFIVQKVTYARALNL